MGTDLPVLQGFTPLDEFLVREGKAATIKVKPARMVVATFDIAGNGSPLCVQKFTEEAKAAMAAKMLEGKTSRSKKPAKDARDFNAEFEAAKHKSREGWEGFNAAAIRNALIDVCRLVDFKMTLAKLSISVVADGWDKEEGVPLVRLYGDPAVQRMHYVSIQSGMTFKPDLRSRPFYENWRARLRIRFDADQFTVADVANLLVRVGQQNGIGAGRPNSKRSNGMGWGTFDVLGIGDVIEPRKVT
jgi:hypothetical protein